MRFFPFEMPMYEDTFLKGILVALTKFFDYVLMFAPFPWRLLAKREIGLAIIAFLIFLVIVGIRFASGTYKKGIEIIEPPAPKPAPEPKKKRKK